MSWVPPGKVMAKVTCFSAFRLTTAAFTLVTSLLPTFSQNLLESVIACPLLLRTIAIFISYPAFPPTPVYTEKGILKRQCAPSSSPVRILSLTFAQDASFVTSTFTPYFSNKPSSLAITIGAQSVSGIKPKLVNLPGGTGSRVGRRCRFCI